MSSRLLDKQKLRDIKLERVDATIEKAPGTSEYGQRELKRMYRELTDDDLIEENRRRHEIEMRLEEKVLDTGYFL